MRAQDAHQFALTVLPRAEERAVASGVRSIVQHVKVDALARCRARRMRADPDDSRLAFALRCLLESGKERLSEDLRTANVGGPSTGASSKKSKRQETNALHLVTGLRLRAAFAVHDAAVR